MRGWFRRLYDCACGRSGRRGRGAQRRIRRVVVLPIPPDPLLIALCLEAPQRALVRDDLPVASRAEASPTTGSAGRRALVSAPLGRYVPGDPEAFERVKALYDRWDFWAVFVAGFTPIPYKVFTLSAGVFQISFPVFVVASLISRSARFFLVAGLIYVFGPGIQGFIDRYFDKLIWLFFFLLVAGFLVIEYVL